MAATSKSKSAPSNAVNRKAKPVTNNGTTEHIPSPISPLQVSFVEYGPGKPERPLFDKEQENIKAEIDALQIKLSAVKDKIGLTSRNGSGNDRWTQLRNELDSIRSQQSNNKFSRSKVLDQLKQVQEGIQKKIKDLNASRAKAKFKTVAEVDARISDLERQVESGNMKLADEKRALLEITQTRRVRRTVESFQAEQDAIDHDKETEAELRKQLDDPEAKAISDRYEVVKAEFDELKKEGDEAFAQRSKLLDERSTLQAQLDTLYNLKRDSAQRFRDANDRHWNKLNEDRARRAEKARAQRAAGEDAKRQERIEQLLEEASEPAYQLQIEDCRTLIDSFSKGTQASEVRFKSLSEKTDVAGVPRLEIRKVDAAAADGLVARKKKGEEEQSYFVGSGGRKGKKGGAKSNGPAEPAPSTASQLNVPLATLSALLSLSIPPPSSTADILRVVEDLKTKKAWFEANQAHETKERVAKAEAEIQQLKSGNKTSANSKANPAIEPPNGSGESPEPVSASQYEGIPLTAVSSEEVTDKLEHVEKGIASEP